MSDSYIYVIHGVGGSGEGSFVVGAYDSRELAIEQMDNLVYTHDDIMDEGPIRCAHPQDWSCSERCVCDDDTDHTTLQIQNNVGYYQLSTVRLNYVHKEEEEEE
jgi:hypothetical protein